MTLKIIRENDLEIDIKKIFLSTFNPRYTTLESIDYSIIKKIKNLNNNSEEKTINKLLSYEGDFFDLRKLFESILDIGFYSRGEKIILVEGEEKNTFIVGEGNRRIMALKFLIGIYEFENFDLDKITNLDNLDIPLINEEDLKNENELIRRRENFEFIKKLIKNIRKKYENKNWEVNAIVVEKDDELWQAIYTKHIAGERPGMRKWSRGKYFTDLLSFLEDGISLEENINSKIRRSLQREPRTIIDDFKHAQFVFAILKNAKIYPSNDVTKNDVFEIMKSIKVSPLQSNFALKRIKDSANDYLGIAEKEFQEKYFDFEFDNKNNLIRFDKKKEIDYRNVLSFIFEQFSKRVITTRPIKKEDKKQFNIEVKKLLSNINIDPQKKYTEEEMDDVDGFDFSVKQLEDIIFNAKKSNFSNNTIRRFQATKDILENSEKIEKINIKSFIVKNEPSEVFERLHLQYLHNEREKNFLNAQASTLRSFIEQFFVWAGYFEKKLVNDLIATNESSESKKNSYVSRIARGRIDRIFLFIRNNFFEEVNINKMLHNLVNKDMSSEATFIFEKQNEIGNVLNEFVHASHRIYNSSDYSMLLEKFSKWQKIIINIFNNMDSKKISLLNSFIKNQIK